MKFEIVNDECPFWVDEYNYDVDDVISQFESQKDTLNINDTLEIICPREADGDCNYRAEMYISQSRFGNRYIRNGSIGNRCILGKFGHTGLPWPKE